MRACMKVKLAGSNTAFPTMYYNPTEEPILSSSCSSPPPPFFFSLGPVGIISNSTGRVRTALCTTGAVLQCTEAHCPFLFSSHLRVREPGSRVVTPLGQGLVDMGIGDFIFFFPFWSVLSGPFLYHLGLYSMNFAVDLAYKSGVKWRQMKVQDKEANVEDVSSSSDSWCHQRAVGCIVWGIDVHTHVHEEKNRRGGLIGGDWQYEQV